MASKPHRNVQAAVSMQRVSRSRFLAAMLVAGMAILIIVPIVLGMAIQQGAIVPLQLDVRLGRLHLLAATTHAPDCDGYVTPCSSDLTSSSGQEFYVIWVLIPTEQLASANEWQTGTRLVVLPLRNQVR